MVTLQDIADEAGVSKMTVSNVVNGNMARVSKENLARIHAIIKKYKYIPNHSARSLTAKSSRIIVGILAGPPDSNLLTDEYNARFFGTVMHSVHEKGYYFMLRSVKNYREVTEQLRSWNVNGAVFIGMPNADIKRTLADNRIPLVFTDSYSDAHKITNIGIDDRKGGRLAAECLLRYGHRMPGFVCYATEDSESLMHQRLRGYQETLTTAGITLKEKHIHHVSGDPTDSTAVIADAHTTAYGKPRTGLPTAYFTTADRLALHLIRAFHERGIRVPQDVSVIGFDNLSFAAFSIPALTTVVQDIDQKARIAVDALFRRIENPTAPVESTVLDVRLIERESVGRPAHP
jgi:LacI family transcriptional regulator